MATTKKIALVTGGNKGIGLEICRNLANAGCTVLLGARDVERGQQAARQLQQAGLDDVHFIEVDVTRQRHNHCRGPADRKAIRLPRHPGEQRRNQSAWGWAARRRRSGCGAEDFRYQFLRRASCHANPAAAAAQIGGRAHRERLQRAGFAHSQQRSFIAHLQHQIQILWLQCIEGSAQHAHSASRIRTARHDDQGELGKSWIHKDGFERQHRNSAGRGWRHRSHAPGLDR